MNIYFRFIRVQYILGHWVKYTRKFNKPQNKKNQSIIGLIKSSSWFLVIRNVNEKNAPLKLLMRFIYNQRNRMHSCVYIYTINI